MTAEGADGAIVARVGVRLWAAKADGATTSDTKARLIEIRIDFPFATQSAPGETLRATEK